MGKILLTKKNIEEYVSQDKNKVYLNRNMILTPGAKDYIRNKGMCIVFEEKSGSPKGLQYTSQLEMMEMKISKILKENYDITDNKKIDDICSIVLNRINEK